MSVRLSAYISCALTGRFAMKCDISNFTKLRQEIPNLVKIGQKYRQFTWKVMYVLLLPTA
jgi:hypothetical protein